MRIEVAMVRNRSQDGVVWIGLGFLLHEALSVTWFRGGCQVREADGSRRWATFRYPLQESWSCCKCSEWIRLMSSVSGSPIRIAWIKISQRPPTRIVAFISRTPHRHGNAMGTCHRSMWMQTTFLTFQVTPIDRRCFVGNMEVNSIPFPIFHADDC